jgi:integrase
MTRAFQGPLAGQFEEFAALMDSTGGQHVTLMRIVGRFDQFLARSHPQATTVTKQVLGAWFATFEHLNPTSQKRYRSGTHQVCKFLRRRDPLTATSADFESVRVRTPFRPFIFSRDEVARLLAGARELRPLPSEPLRPWSTELIIALLYTAGLRISEAVRLQVRDYDPGVGSLVIRETKFAKTRLVPLSASAWRLIEAYLRRRRDVGLSCNPEDPLRCCPSNHPPSIGSVQVALARLMRSCGLKPPKGRGPRIHDMRHTFAVNRVLEWYREGKDVQALLPNLVTYMGHRGLESTQRYLSLTPAVLHEASSRFEKFAVTLQTPAVVRP